MSVKVFYHGNCPDGFTAAWAARQVYPEAEFEAVYYESKLPLVDSKTTMSVFFVDFCPPRAYLDSLADEGVSIVILDHHETAEAALLGTAFNGDTGTAWNRGAVVFDMERSGAGIAWDYFHQEPRPALINYVEDRDLWKHALTYSRAINGYIMSWEYDWATWDFLAEKLSTEAGRLYACDHGITLLRAQQKRVSMICDQASKTSLGSVTAVPIVNATSDWSEVGEELNRRYPELPFAVSYYDKADGQRIFSLRTQRDDVNVSTVALARGGGGHRKAAGFRAAAPART